jgi:RimJ/RimL family protein N-acetyltransferase
VPGRALDVHDGGDAGAVVPLHDGGRILLRPAGTHDGPRIADGFARCSAGTRYFRFLTGGYELTDERLAALTGADQHDHVVWLAIDTADPARRLAALARFVRSTTVPRAAEVAFIVADEYQGRGVSRLLLDALRVSAAMVGVEVFEAQVLAENEPMKALLLHRGARVIGRDGPELQLELALDDPALGALDPGLVRALQSAAGDRP